MLESGQIVVREDVDCPKVRAFLESKARNSVNTAEAYEQALSRFKWYLERKHPTYDLESIVPAILNKQVDVYVLIDGFIGFLLKMPADLIKARSLRNPAPSKVRQFIEAIKSYLTFHDVDIIPQKFKNKVTVPSNIKEDERPRDKESFSESA